MPVLARRANPFGEIRVVSNRRTGAISYVQGSWYQSRADRFGVSLMGYIHALFGLLVGLDARRIVLIGGAGGTLGSMLARIGRRVTIVDIDPHAFTVARNYFGLDPGVDCRVADGRRFLAGTRARFDAIVLDAYWRGTAPAHLCTLEFFALARRRLPRNGAILFNAIAASDSDPHPDRIAESMMAAGLPARILDTLGETHRNAIIVGTKARLPRRPRLLMRPAAIAGDIAEELDAMVFRAPRPCNPILDSDAHPIMRRATAAGSR
ncbi:MAG TPA: fused MFS/spermidine synthase [Alphaproteobacteria bacterium]|nr:fused MFS/spermidine synthase [Alphaproteobacteria bacterium]